MLNKKTRHNKNTGKMCKMDIMQVLCLRVKVEAHHTSKPFKTKLMQVCNNKCNNLNKTILTMVFLMLHILMSLELIKKEVQAL